MVPIYSLDSVSGYLFLLAVVSGFNILIGYSYYLRVSKLPSRQALWLPSLLNRTLV